MSRIGVFRKSKNTLSDTFCDIYEHVKLPEKLTDEVWSAMMFVKEIYTQYVDHGTELQAKMLSTPFFKYVLEMFGKKINDSGEEFPLKYSMLSAHDTTVNCLLFVVLFNFRSPLS